MVDTSVPAVPFSRVTMMDLRVAKGSPTQTSGWIAKQVREDTKMFGRLMTSGLGWGWHDVMGSVFSFPWSVPAHLQEVFEVLGTPTCVGGPFVEHHD